MFLLSAKFPADAGQLWEILQVPPKTLFKRLLLETLLWQYPMSTTLKSPPKVMKDLECEKRTLTVQPPIPYIPWGHQAIKVKFPNGTNFQMFAFGQGNNEVYLVHVIAIKHLLEQKKTVQDIGKAFQVVVEVRKQLEPLLKAPEGKTKVEKDEQRNALSAIKEDLKAARELAVVETLKVYKLYCCFVVSKAQM
jgi:hypothetical protein